MFRKNIFTAASPNTQGDDAWLALKMLVQPWKWYKNEYNHEFKNHLQKYFNQENVALIDSWRSGFYIFLKSQGIKDGDEIILPSFTCVVVANAARWTGAKPIYLDTNKKDFNADYSTLKKFINKKTKVILIQHTFGKIVDVDEIKATLKELGREDIILVEDFAHTISSKNKIKADVGIFTFGIEKVISSVRGGAVVVKDKFMFDKLEDEINKLSEFPRSQVFKSLANPIFWYFAIPLHSVGFGRFTIGAFIRTIWRKLGFLGIMVEKSENYADKPNWFPAKMNPALSRLGLNQLKKLDKFNQHRTEIAKIYHSKLSKFSDEKDFDDSRVYLRYPLLFKNEKQFIEAWDKLRELGITAGNWFASPLYGATVNKSTYKKLCFVPAETPETSNKTGLTMNLPTSVNINENRAKEAAMALEKIL